MICNLSHLKPQSWLHSLILKQAIEAWSEMFTQLIALLFANNCVIYVSLHNSHLFVLQLWRFMRALRHVRQIS
jgi:hypothetical protein